MPVLRCAVVPLYDEYEDESEDESEDDRGTLTDLDGLRWCSSTGCSRVQDVATVRGLVT